MTGQRMPVLFLGHGSPMTVITDGPERRSWQALGLALPRPRAILVVSAHWETQGHTHLTTGDFPRTIHDFRGFPEELYAMRYPAPGSPELVRRVTELLGADRVRPDSSWGFDHGAWGVVQPLFPAADIPMVVMSLDRSLSNEQHLALGERLAPLRDEGVLAIANGNIIHNLALWRQTAGTVPGWVAAFHGRTNDAILAHDTRSLVLPDGGDEAARLAVNSGEHYIPLLYAMGMKRDEDAVALFNDTLDGALSMTSVLLGDASLLAGLEA